MPDLAFKNVCLFNMNQVNIVNIDILNIEQLSHLILVLKLLTGNSLLGRMISQTKTLKIKSFLPFNFAITKICVAIHV